MLWSRGENEDRTLSALRVAMWSMKAPEGWSTPALEKRTAHSTHLCQGMGRGHVCVQSPHCLRVGHSTPSVRCRERRQVSDVLIDGAVTKEPLVSHQHLHAQRKEITGPLALGGPTPEPPLYSSSQSPDRGRSPGVPDRGPGPQKQQSLQAGNLHLSRV